MKKNKTILIIFSLICLNLSGQVVSIVQKELQTPWYGFGYNQWGYARESDGVTFKPWNKDLWKTTKDRILAINPSLVRLPLMREWFNMDDMGNELPIGIYNWNSKYMQAFYKIMDLYKEHNIAVLSGLWHSGYDIFGREYEDFYVTKGEGSFAHLQGDLIDYLINVKKYTNIIFYTPTNEPLGSISNFDVWKTMMINLYEEMSNRGLPTEILIGADSWGDWVWLPARENKNELVGYDFHNYLNDTPDDTFTLLYERTLERNLKNSLSRIYQEDNTNKPVLVTEMAPIGVPYIDWPVETAPPHCRIDTYEYGLNYVEYAIQLMRSGLASGLAWGLDGFDQNKNAGMWNNAGTYGGMHLRPWYYSWQLMCRYFPAHATILEMSETKDSKDIRIAGAKIGADDYSFAITNRRTEAKSDTKQITLKAHGNAKIFYLYLYSRNCYGNGVDLSLPYQIIHTEDMENDGVTIEIPLESAVILTTLAPLNKVNKPTAKKTYLDFETTKGYNLSADKNLGVNIHWSTNPRKQTSNDSEMVCTIMQTTSSNQTSNPDNAFALIELDSLFEIINEKKHLAFQVFRNGYNSEFTFGFKLNGDEKIYGSNFYSVNRNWHKYTMDLSSLINNKIELFYIFPNRNFSKTNSNSEEYIYFDNIFLSSSEEDAQQIEIVEIKNLPLFAFSCDYDFEYKNVNSILTASQYGTTSINSNPSIQEINPSEKVCKSTYAAPTDHNLSQFHFTLNPYPEIIITQQKPYLNFQVLRRNNLSTINVEIQLKNKKERISNTFSVSERRRWESFSFDLSTYIGEIIENIFFYPNISNPTSLTDECYFDNILLSNVNLETGFNTITDKKKHQYYTKNNTLNILEAQSAKLTIYTINGKDILSTIINSSTFQVNLDSGIYIMQIDNSFYKLINQ